MHRSVRVTVPILRAGEPSAIGRLADAGDDCGAEHLSASCCGRAEVVAGDPAHQLGAGVQAELGQAAL
jgi:hypothetical protein